MSDSWQYIIVGIVVAAAFILALRSIIQAIQHKKSALNPCDSCPLNNSCTKEKSNCDNYKALSKPAEKQTSQN